MVVSGSERLAVGAPGLFCVTSGVTWGQPTFAPASCLDRTPSKTRRQAAGIEFDGIEAMPVAAGELRGSFVEMARSAEGGRAPKPLKNMVGATGIEPVTPTMSR